ncbi:MAG TPA: type I methionyl aminopeptidase [Elusimicrobiota bacterium]|nr:type I methionyl aminopeptidase [Elusimicrobiota bacterium]
MTGDRCIELKTPKELVVMRRAGRLAGLVLKEISRLMNPGVTTKDLDVRAEKMIRDAGAVPTFLGYCGYPASICASLNDEVVHGIPHPKRVLKEGDIVSIDVGVTLDGFVGDTAGTFPVGRVSEEARRLLETTRRSLEKGMEQARVGRRLGDVSSAIQVCAESAGFSVVRDYSGHGIGRQMHEGPSIPNFGAAGTGIRLEEGLVLALEPMINQSDWKVKVLGDGWTVVTRDGGLSAHFEHTVAVTSDGPEILTSV